MNPFKSFIIPSEFEATPISVLDLESTTATVETSLNGTQTIPVSKIFYENKPTSYALVTNEVIEKDGFILNKNIQTLDFSNIGFFNNDYYKKLISYISAPPFESSDNTWAYPEDPISQRALDIHFGANLTLDYYFDQFNRNGVDGYGAQTLLNAVAPLQIDPGTRDVEDGHNAYWWGENFTYEGITYGMMVYLDGQDRGIMESTGVIAGIDVLGHELSHGLTQYTAGLVYKGESGALNESISDIFGTLVKAYSKDQDFQSDDWTWTIGEGFFEIRDMKDPESYNDPSVYQGRYWRNTNFNSYDNGGVHHNSGVPNHWFALATDGSSSGPHADSESHFHTNGNGYTNTIRGLGLEKTQGVVYRALNNYLQSDSNFLDAREATLQAARDLTRQRVSDAYPGVPRLTRSDVKQIKAAWNAVGVGGGTKPSNLRTTEASEETPDFIGNKKNNEFVGNDANNTAKGRSGFDLLHGGGGKDRLFGGKDNDVLDGGDGNDRLTGGAGYDRFLMSPGKDKIKDFEPGVDRIIWDRTVRIVSSETNYPILEHALGETHLVGTDYGDFIEEIPFSTQGVIASFSSPE